MNTKSNNMTAVGMMATGFLLIVLAWNGAASVDTIQQQFPYLLSGGVAGLGLIAAGIGLLLVQEQRRSMALLEHKLDQLLTTLSQGDVDATATLVAKGHLTDRQRRALERAGAN